MSFFQTTNEPELRSGAKSLTVKRTKPTCFVGRCPTVCMAFNLKGNGQRPHWASFELTVPPVILESGVDCPSRGGKPIDKTKTEKASCRRSRSSNGAKGPFNSRKAARQKANMRNMKANMLIHACTHHHSSSAPSFQWLLKQRKTWQNR